MIVERNDYLYSFLKTVIDETLEKCYFKYMFYSTSALMV